MAERNEHKSAKYQDGDIYLNPCFGDLWVVDGASFIKINNGYAIELDEPEGFIKVGHPDEVKESYLEGEDLNDNAVVLDDIAWAERYGKNFDWKIFAAEQGAPVQTPTVPLFNTLR